MKKKSLWEMQAEAKWELSDQQRAEMTQLDSERAVPDGPGPLGRLVILVCGLCIGAPVWFFGALGIFLTGWAGGSGWNGMEGLLIWGICTLLVPFVLATFSWLAILLTTGKSTFNKRWPRILLLAIVWYFIGWAGAWHWWFQK